MHGAVMAGSVLQSNCSRPIMAAVCLDAGQPPGALLIADMYINNGYGLCALQAGVLLLAAAAWTRAQPSPVLNM
jgi:hypothetical protein